MFSLDYCAWHKAVLSPFLSVSPSAAAPSDQPSVSVSPLAVPIMLDNTGLDIIMHPRKTQYDIFSW